MIHTERLVIRNLLPSDFENFCRYYLDPTVEKPVSALDETTMAKLVFEASLKNKYCFALELKSEAPKIIGEVHFADIVLDYLAYIGFAVNKNYRNNGYCKEAVAALTGYGFNSLGFGRIRALCLLQNIPSQRVLQACGYSREALIYEAEFGGRLGDVFYYSKSAFCADSTTFSD